MDQIYENLLNVAKFRNKMSVIQYLQEMDLRILHVINTNLAHSWNDILFRVWSSEAPWFLLAGFFFVQTAYRRQWGNFRALLWLGATVGFADALAAQIIKPWVGRIRPCKLDEFVRVVDGCAGSLSFPSNHSANGAAFAIFWLLWKGPKAGAMALGCWFFVGFSRVYLGVHYPSDVLGGFAIGSLIALISFALYKASGRWTAKKMNSKSS
jgi:undecaprenyl-diphosphatase